MVIDDDQKKGSRSKIANYQKILANNPRSFIFAQLAEEYIKLGNADRAIEICREGLTYNPDFADGLYVMGVALFKNGRKENARTIFFRILAKQNDHFLAREALKRMGYSDDEITKGITTLELGESIDGEEELSLEGVLPDEETRPPEIARDPGHSREAAARQSVRRAVPSAAGDIRTAKRSSAAAATELDDDDEEREPMPAWIKIAIPLVLIVLGVAGFFGWQYYKSAEARREIVLAHNQALESMRQDTQGAYLQTANDLETALAKHPKALMLKGLLVETYARLLIDFDPGNNQWKRQMEARFAGFPPDSFSDSYLLSAQAYRAMSLDKPGEVRFLIDTARERGLLRPSMICLEGELAAYDRNWTSAIAAYDRVLNDTPDMMRALFKKAESQFMQKDYAAAKITLDLLLEKEPEHKRGRLLLLATRLESGESVAELQKALTAQFKDGDDSLPPLPRSLLLYMKARIASQLDDKNAALELARNSVALYPRARSLFLLATLQFEKQEYDNAKRNLNAAIEKLPDEKAYHAFLGRIYFLEDNKTEALKQMEMAIDDSTDQLDLLVMAGDAAARLRMFEKAVVYYERASFVNFQNLDLKKKLVLTYIAKGDLKDARRRIDKLLLEHADDPVTYYLHGRYLLADGEARAAREAFTKGLKLDPTNREILIEISKLHFDENEVEKGLEILRELETIYPEDADVLKRLARMSLAADSRVKARNYYERLAALRPQLADYRLRLAYLDYLDGKHEAAKKVVEEALARDPNLGYGHILRGIFLFKEGDPKRAEAQIQHGIQLDSKNPEGHFWLGRIKKIHNDPTWAKNEFEITLEIQPIYPMAILEIADIHFGKSQFDQARETYTDALELFMLFEDTRAYQVRIYTRLGEIEIMRSRVPQGLKLVRKASQMDPTAVEPLYILARDAIDKYRNKAKTIRTLKKAQELDPDFAPIYYELGMMYMASDRTRDAVNAFRQYLRLKPKGQFADDARAHIDKLVK